MQISVNMYIMQRSIAVFWLYIVLFVTVIGISFIDFDNMTKVTGIIVRYINSVYLNLSVHCNLY